MDKEYYAKKTELSELSQEVNNKANAKHSHSVSDISDINNITEEIDSVEKTANQALSKAGQAYEIAISFKKPIVIKGRVDSIGDLQNQSSEVPPMEGWIYFVGKKSAESSYEEYIYIDDHWELIGTTAQGIDLTNVKISDLIDDTTEASHINWAENAKYAINAGDATKANAAKAIVDHSSISNNIYINYTGDGLSTDNINYIAAFDSSGNIGKATVSNLVSKIREENDFVQIRKISTENTINFNTDFLLDQSDDPIKVIFDCSQGTNNYSTVGAPPLKNNTENAVISFIMTVEKIYNASSYSLKQHCIVFELNNMSNATISEYERYKLPTLTPGVDRWTEWKSTKAYVPIISIPYVEGENIDLNDYTLYSKDPAKAIYEGSTYRPIAGIVNCPASMNWSLQASFLLTVERINVSSDYINKDIVKQHIIMYGTGASGRLADTKEFVRYSYRNASENTLEWTDWEEVNTVDSTLSENSKNPVQNSVITGALNEKLDKGSSEYVPIRILQQDEAIDFNNFTLENSGPAKIIYDGSIGFSFYNISNGPSLQTGTSKIAFILAVERLYQKSGSEKAIIKQSCTIWNVSSGDDGNIDLSHEEFIRFKGRLATAEDVWGKWERVNAIDSALSNSSKNPVQNSVITEAINSKLDISSNNYIPIEQIGDAVDFNNEKFLLYNDGLHIKIFTRNGTPTVDTNSPIISEVMDFILVVEKIYSFSGHNHNVRQHYIGFRYARSEMPKRVGYERIVTFDSNTNAFDFGNWIEIDNKITSPATGSVGQLLAVESIDGNNKPLSWKTVGVADISTDITVDDALSTTSTNPVQNKVVTTEINKRITSPTSSSVNQLLAVETVDSNKKPTSWTTIDGAPKIVQEYMEGGSEYLPVLLGNDPFEYYDDGNLKKENKTCAAKRTAGLTFHPNSGTLKVGKLEGTASNATNADRATSADSAKKAEEATAIQQNFIMQSPNAYPLLGSADSDLTQSNITGTPYKFHGLTFTPTSGTLSVRVVDASEFTGKAATAGKADRATSADSATQADKATALIDYTDTGTTVQVGYSGSSVSADDATYVAVYTSGAHIKDMSFNSLASKLTSSSNFRPIQYSTSDPGSSLTTGTVWLQYES